MIFLVYAAETDQSIVNSLGLPEYSYFFVMKIFLPVLEELGQVVVVTDLATVDTQFDALSTNGAEVVLLSFTPPQKTPLGLRCPTFPVFAWEFNTIPNETWGNEPRQDWTHVLKALPGAITHSRFTVDAVRAKLGAACPVVSLPAPLWDDYAPLYRAQTGYGKPWQLDIVKGVILDSHALDLHAESTDGEISFMEKPCSVELNGIIYTSVFNPNDGRKNWLDLLFGFCYAFRDNPDVTLVMKMTYHDARIACGIMLHEMRRPAPYRCRVIAIQGYLESSAYRQLVANSTYVVNTAYGEGQCLPLMEFMSAGKPAVAPDHSAMADYIDGKNAFIVRSSEEWTHWPHDPRLVLRAFRYRINWESLRDAYLESWRVANSAPEEYRRMSRHAHQTLRRQCSRKTIARELTRFLQRLGYTPRNNSILAGILKKLVAGLRQTLAAR